LSLIGTLPWVLALALAGHALGSDWKSVRKGFEYLDYAIVVLAVAGAGYAVLRRRRRREDGGDAAGKVGEGLPEAAGEAPPVTDAG
ncbi:MAG TPA: hypothetical protein VMG62_00385, partial [Solirubrobacteraceae bacterium]|nr:hypothetical protein [Solirubrobacteraceae bacterium]